MAINEVTNPYRVYDIKKAKLYVNGTEITGIGEDGYGMTPDAENTLIKGLKGDVGFNIDPADSAVCVINLKSASPSHAVLNDIYNQQRNGLLGPVSVEIIVEPDWVLAFGFRKRVMAYAYVQTPSAFETDGKEAPSMEWMMIGFGYDEESS